MIAATLAAVYSITTWNYHRSLKLFLDDSDDPWPEPREPPQIPYLIPWLGNTFSFLKRRPGQPWRELLQWFPRSAGACTLLVGGKPMHILLSPHGIQAMFKDHTATRTQMDAMLYRGALRMSEAQIQQTLSTRAVEHEIDMKYLLRADRVAELTTTFTEYFHQQLTIGSKEGKTVSLYDWLRGHMFEASVTALFGSSLLDEYPEYRDDYFHLDANFIPLVFGLPAFIVPEAAAVRDRVLSRILKWHAKTAKHWVDPDSGPAWEPHYGSRYNRARQQGYRRRQLEPWSNAGLDYGLSFGLNSNAIPATGWMLMHILDPRDRTDLHARIVEELKTARRTDTDTGHDSLDIAKLMSLPLLQSVWTETLRLSSDVLVFRDLETEMIVPLDPAGKRRVRFRKGGDLVAPTWIAREDPAAWVCDGAPPDLFWAERFLVPHPEGGEEKVFSSAGTGGTFFPFGGGRTMCPGRLFAKQEALAAVAMVLLRFELEVLGFVDKKGEETSAFPSHAKGFPGGAVLNHCGDLKVRVRLRL